MVRNGILAAVLGLAALAAGPAASTVRAETPRQVWLQNHPAAAARIWAAKHPAAAGTVWREKHPALARRGRR